MHNYVIVVVLLVVTYLAAYAHGRHHGRQAAEEKLPKFLVRPHTEETIQHYPLPEEQPAGDVSEVQWGRPDLPNSGVRWS
jgi:hypothetical protein